MQVPAEDPEIEDDTGKIHNSQVCACVCAVGGSIHLH